MADNKKKKKSKRVKILGKVKTKAKKAKDFAIREYKKNPELYKNIALGLASTAFKKKPKTRLLKKK